VEEGDSAGLEFDLGTPDQSTLLRRRQIRRRPSRRYTGTATNGDFYKLCVRPDRSTIDYVNLSRGTAGTLSFLSPRQERGRSDAVAFDLHDSNGRFTKAVELPGRGLVLAANPAPPNPAAGNPDWPAAVNQPTPFPQAPAPPAAADGAYARLLTGCSGTDKAAGAGGAGGGGGDGAWLVFGLPEGELEPGSIPTGDFGFMQFAAAPGRAEAGFVSSSHGLKRGEHRLRHQSFAPAKDGWGVFAETGMDLSGLTASSSGDHVEANGGYPLRIFAGDGLGDNRVVAVSVPDRGCIIMLPQAPSTDLPFPTRASYLALATVHRTDAVGSFSETNRVVSGDGGSVAQWRLDVNAADGSVALWLPHEKPNMSPKRFAAPQTENHGLNLGEGAAEELEDQVKKGRDAGQEHPLFEGQLRPVSQVSSLFEGAEKDAPQLVDPCHGTFVVSAKATTHIQPQIPTQTSSLVAQFAHDWCLFAGRLPRKDGQLLAVSGCALLSNRSGTPRPNTFTH
jgi:hypothetical protein